MSNKSNKNDKKAGKSTKGEIIAYVILGVMAVAIVAAIIVVFVTTSGGGGGSTLLPPCCQ